MKRIFLAVALAGGLQAQAQDITITKSNATTEVKNQQQTGTCWCFSTTSLVESECLRNDKNASIDISEMFTVRNIYIEKAKNYVLRQGYARFDEGGLGHDAIRAISLYGAMPQEAYTGLVNGATMLNHSKMVPAMKTYLDSILKIKKPLPNWLPGFEAILDEYMGAAPKDFQYNGKTYTAKSFAKDVMKFDANNYVGLTSFTHHPYNQTFVVEVPDNFSNGQYYNLPLSEFIAVTKKAVQNGYTVMWDADVSNRGFAQNRGYAFSPVGDTIPKATPINPDIKEVSVTPEYRQGLYENLVTQDDHLMHITGLGKSKDGKDFFVVKNSWSDKAGPFKGYVYVSEPYFAVNTITVIIPKAALDKELQKKIGNSTTY
ncbi:C1 family peptidase [Chitinophaga skermanii]|nr:C1 family peptidase [Chitinophaga skermanii]